MLKKVVVVVGGLVLVLLAVVASRPDTYSVQRSIVVSAPGPVVAGLIRDFREWKAWSPWEKKDPAMKQEFTGSGVGSTYSWEGNQEVGKGRMTITEESPDRLALKLEFLAPWASTATTEFTYLPEGSGTEVSWRMSGTHDFMGKAMSLFMDMDKMVGSDFEQGLASLKIEAEAKAKVASAH